MSEQDSAIPPDLANGSPDPVCQPANLAPRHPSAAPSEPGVDPSTRLALARLASGTTRLLDPAPRDRASSPLASSRARVLALASMLSPTGLLGSDAPRVGRLELSAFGAALVGATLIGATLPHPQPVEARALASSSGLAPAAAITPAAVPTPTATSSTEAAANTASTSDATAAAVDTAPAADLAVAAATASGTNAPSAAPAADETTGDTEDPDAAASDDPLGNGNGKYLKQVALVIVHGDAPLRWRDAPAGSAARKRAALGTTFTGFAQLPAAPLVSELGLIAGQTSNPQARAGCDAASPVTPGTIDQLGHVAGVGCDYPAGTPSLPTAVAIDGRRWKAYAPVEATEAAGALCGTGTPAGPSATFARTSALRRLADLTSSGACDAAASPLSALATDLAGDDAPAWLVIEVGACESGACDAATAEARDRDLDTALATLSGPAGLAPESAVIVVGDGAVEGAPAAESGAVPASADDPDAPAAIATGALLVGAGVAVDQTDPLALDPLALARTQATWLGLTPPGAAAIEGTAALAVPSA